MPNEPLLADDNFQNYIDSIIENARLKTGKSKKLSVAKLLVLSTLWNAGDSFPKDWVLSNHLYELTNQKYIDRRIRELRNEMGCDIETGIHNGEHSYRLLSDALNEAFDRTYLSEAQKKHLFKNHHYRCATCGQQYESGDKGLQADHKVPLIRGGGSELQNWQPLCIACNVAKRRSCMGCEVDCNQCAWAFPEKYGQTIPIALSSGIGERLQAIARVRDCTPQELILEAVQQMIDTVLSDGEL